MSFARWRLTDNEIHTIELSHKLTKWRAYEIITLAHFYFVLCRHDSNKISISFFVWCTKVSFHRVACVFVLLRKIVIYHSLDESSFCVLNFIFGFLFALTIFHVFSLVFLKTNAYSHLASVKWFLCVLCISMFDRNMVEYSSFFKRSYKCVYKSFWWIKDMFNVTIICHFYSSKLKIEQLFDCSFEGTLSLSGSCFWWSNKRNIETLKSFEHQTIHNLIHYGNSKWLSLNQ